MAEKWYSSGIPTCFSAIGRYMYISASVCESRTTRGKLLDKTFRCVYFVFASPINSHLSHLKYTVVNHFTLYIVPVAVQGYLVYKRPRPPPRTLQ